MDVRKCKLFVLTAETRNISKTAELTGYTQSGVSHTLKALEDEVGVKLFSRD
jgi:DNA-binding transcriptional LysR family regulator